MAVRIPGLSCRCYGVASTPAVICLVRYMPWSCDRGETMPVSQAIACRISLTLRRGPALPKASCQF